MLFARLILGSLAAGTVGMTVWPLDNVSLEFAVLAAVWTLALAGFASHLSRMKNRNTKVAPLLFATPFAVVAAAWLPALIRGSVRPCLFWLACALVAWAFSATGDLFTFRKIVEKEES